MAICKSAVVSPKVIVLYLMKFTNYSEIETVIFFVLILKFINGPMLETSLEHEVLPTEPLGLLLVEPEEWPVLATSLFWNAAKKHCSLQEPWYSVLAFLWWLVIQNRGKNTITFQYSLKLKCSTTFTQDIYHIKHGNTPDFIFLHHLKTLQHLRTIMTTVDI